MTDKKYADVPTGTTNTQDDNGILGLAQKHAHKLHEEFGEKTFSSMKTSIKNNMRDKNWAAMKQLLELAFVAAFDKKPIVLMLVMKNDEEFQEYCECLYGEMEKLT